MTNPELTKIKAKIRALTAKTTSNGCTEEEAMSAMEKVGELLEVYNLNLAEVHLSEEICVEAKVHLGRRTIPRWAFIFATIGAFTHTKAWTNRPNVHFFGFEPDVQMATYLAQVVLRSLKTEVKEFQKTATYRTSYRRKFATNSFQMGLIQRLNERLVRPPSKERGLVLHKLAMVEDALAKQLPELRLTRRPSTRYRYNADAHRAGQAAGDRVNINRPVSQDRTSHVAGYLT